MIRNDLALYISLADMFPMHSRKRIIAAIWYVGVNPYQGWEYETPVKGHNVYIRFNWGKDRFIYDVARRLANKDWQ